MKEPKIKGTILVSPDLHSLVAEFIIANGYDFEPLIYEEPNIPVAIFDGVAYVDVAEPLIVESELIKLGLEIKRVALKVGEHRTFDIMNEEQTAGVERKTVADFIQSMNDGRLFIQAAKMFYSGKKSAIVIIGPHFNQGGIQNRILGTIASLTTHYNIPVVHFEDEESAAYFIVRFLTKASEPKVISTSYMVDNKELRRVAQQVANIASIEGVGETTAVAILKKFRNVQNVANASYEELSEVKTGKEGKKRKVPKGVINAIWNTYHDDWLEEEEEKKDLEEFERMPTLLDFSDDFSDEFDTAW